MANQPLCISKKDEHGNWLCPVKGALDPNDIAIAIGERLLRYHNNDDLRGRVDRLKEAGQTMIIVEQSLNVALAIAERAVLMEKGRIQFEGTPDEATLARL